MEQFNSTKILPVASTISTGQMDAANDNSMSKSELYVVLALLAFFVLLGVSGNLLVLYVFAKKRDKLVSTLFILTLAVVDFTTCLIVIPYTMYMEYVNFKLHYDIVCKVYQFLITSNVPFSAFIMTAIAVDRYFCICHPFLHAITPIRAKVMITCLGLYAACLGIVTGLAYGTYTVVYFPQYASTPSGEIPGVTHNGTRVDYNPLVSYGNTSAKYYGRETSTYDIDTNGANIANATPEHRPPHSYIAKVHFIGECAPNTIYISEEFRWYYQKYYIAMYIISLIIVIVLYLAIYNSVHARRVKRQKQKSKSLSLVQAHNEVTTDTHEETQLTSLNGDGHVVRNGATGNVDVKGATHRRESKKDSHRRKSTRKDRNRIANLKTAAMLFVVTVVFVVTFLPAFLMSTQLLTHNPVVFYMYFANNVANPVIYSFMNKNFRDDLKRLFNCS